MERVLPEGLKTKHKRNNNFKKTKRHIDKQNDLD